MHRIVADPAELRHSLGHSDPVAASDLVRLAKRIEGVRARAATGDFERLRRLPMPVLANGADGWFVIGRVGEDAVAVQRRSEEHTSELQSLMRISYAVFCLKKKKHI